MAASKLRIALNDAGARAKLQALIKAAGDPTPIYQTVGRTILNRIRLCFKLGIDPWGAPWAALKLRQGQPLRDTGRLNRSIVANPDKNGVTIGTNVMYAPTHQYGATISPKNAKKLVFPGPGGRMIFAKKVTIPARPFMPLRKNHAAVALPPQWSADVTRAIRNYFINAATKKGGA